MIESGLRGIWSWGDEIALMQNDDDMQEGIQPGVGNNDQPSTRKRVNSESAMVRFVKVSAKYDSNSVNVCRPFMNVIAKLNGCGGTQLLVDTWVGRNILYSKISRKRGVDVGGACMKIIGIFNTIVFTQGCASVTAHIGNVT